MARKSLIEKEKKRAKLVESYMKKRLHYKSIINSPHTSSEVKMETVKLLDKLPKNSSPVRIRTRCYVTGRPRAVFRDFGLSRNVILRLARDGFFPGVYKY